MGFLLLHRSWSPKPPPLRTHPPFSPLSPPEPFFCFADHAFFCNIRVVPYAAAILYLAFPPFYSAYLSAVIPLLAGLAGCLSHPCSRDDEDPTMMCDIMPGSHSPCAFHPIQRDTAFFLPVVFFERRPFFVPNTLLAELPPSLTFFFGCAPAPKSMGVCGLQFWSTIPFIPSSRLPLLRSDAHSPFHSLPS